MDRVEAIALAKRYRDTVFRRGYLLAQGREKTTRFHRTLKVEKVLHEQLIDAMTKADNQTNREQAGEWVDELIEAVVTDCQDVPGTGLAPALRDRIIDAMMGKE